MFGNFCYNQIIDKRDETVLKRKFFAFLLVILCFFTVLLSGCNDIFASDEEKALNRAHSDEFYASLTEKEQADFDSKLKAIIDSESYINLDKKQKEELVDKFVESEKVEKEVVSAPVDKDPEEIQSQISDLKNNLQDVQNELSNLKENGASEEEIKEAEQKQQEVEDQIKSAEQEKAYWEIVQEAKSALEKVNFNLDCCKINGIYIDSIGTVYINADFIKKEPIGGHIYKSKENQYLQVLGKKVNANATYNEIITLISNAPAFRTAQICTNKNLQSHKDYFEKNKQALHAGIEVREQQGYYFEILDSWEQENDSHPNYLIKATKDGKTKYILIAYYSNQNSYDYLELQKACPEFWAQLEIENAK